MMDRVFRDAGSKYHKMSKFLAGTEKRCIPYRPKLFPYDHYYHNTYPKERYNYD